MIFLKQKQEEYCKAGNLWAIMEKCENDIE